MRPRSANELEADQNCGRARLAMGVGQRRPRGRVPHEVGHPDVDAEPLRDGTGADDPVAMRREAIQGLPVKRARGVLETPTSPRAKPDRRRQQREHPPRRAHEVGQSRRSPRTAPVPTLQADRERPRRHRRAAARRPRCPCARARRCRPPAPAPTVRARPCRSPASTPTARTTVVWAEGDHQQAPGTSSATPAAPRDRERGCGGGPPPCTEQRHAQRLGDDEQAHEGARGAALAHVHHGQVTEAQQEDDRREHHPRSRLKVDREVQNRRAPRGACRPGPRAAAEHVHRHPHRDAHVKAPARARAAGRRPARPWPARTCAPSPHASDEETARDESDPGRRPPCPWRPARCPPTRPPCALATRLERERLSRDEHARRPRPDAPVSPTRKNTPRVPRHAPRPAQ